MNNFVNLETKDIVDFQDIKIISKLKLLFMLLIYIYIKFKTLKRATVILRNYFVTVQLQFNKRFTR